MKHKNCWTNFKSIESIVAEQKAERRALVVEVIGSMVLAIAVVGVSIVVLCM